MDFTLPLEVIYLQKLLNNPREVSRIVRVLSARVFQNPREVRDLPSTIRDTHRVEFMEKNTD